MLLSKYQSGFGPLYSTLKALDMTDICYLNIEDGQTNVILFIEKKHLIQLTKRSFCQNWSYTDFKVQVSIFFVIELLRLQL